MYDLFTQEPFIAALVTIAGLAIVFGGVLGFASVCFRTEGDPIVDQIDALLPQTQCRRCGYPGCRPYAQAIANGDAINKCPPGGQATINSLATLLGVEAPALDKEYGEERDVKHVAFIREAECIGCTKCIQACPVDAILGAARHMHTVIVDECTGCDLCVDPCPVDCIEMIPVKQTIDDWMWPFSPLVQCYRAARSEIRRPHSDRIRSDRARMRFERRKQRKERANTEKGAQRQARQQTKKTPSTEAKDDHSKDLIAQAIARVQASKSSSENQRARQERNVATAESRVKSARKRLADAGESDAAKREALQASLGEAERKLKNARKKLVKAEEEVATGNARPSLIDRRDIGEN